MSDALGKLDEVRRLVIEGEVRFLGMTVVTSTGQFYAIDMDECDVADLGRSLISVKMLEDAVLAQVGAFNANGVCEECGVGCESDDDDDATGGALN